MEERQIRWGLANGASVLALGGFFWFGISFGLITTRFGWWVWGLSTAAQVAMTGAIVWRARALRRASGFAWVDLRRGDEQQQARTAHIGRVFGWTAGGHLALVSAAVWLCVRSGANNLLWPAIGLVTSLHFAPLARVFHVRAYYATAIAGSMISIAGLVGLSNATRLAWFGGGMAAVMWLSAWYVIQNAKQIAATAAQETWAA